MRRLITPSNRLSRRAMLAGAAAGGLAACTHPLPGLPHVVPAPYTPPTGPSPVERHGAIRAEGARILDQHGEPVMLRGMSLFWAQWMPQFYNADAVAWLRRDWNVNVIRAAIPPMPGGYIDHPERETAKAEAVIDAALAEGIYVVVDWHAHEPATEAALAFFSHIAQKYAGAPNIIYEPWNEPLPRHHWAEHIKPHHRQIIDVIRAHDPNNLIVAGTSTWSQDVDEAAADPLDDPNLAYTLHFYAGTHRQGLRDKASAALAMGKALFVTEYGTTEATGDGPIDVEETQRWWDFMEQNGLSYLCWSIADKEETSAALRPGAAPNGGWPDDMITPSGLMLRERIRAMNT